MENKKEKPTIIATREFKKSLVDLINHSEVPSFILLEILEKVTQDVRMVVDTVYQQEAAAYEKELHNAAPFLLEGKEDEH